MEFKPTEQGISVDHKGAICRFDISTKGDAFQMLNEEQKKLFMVGGQLPATVEGPKFLAVKPGRDYIEVPAGAAKGHRNAAVAKKALELLAEKYPTEKDLLKAMEEYAGEQGAKKKTPKKIKTPPKNE
jgi:glyoxylate utilization-related uncharacterized protein